MSQTSPSATETANVTEDIIDLDSKSTAPPNLETLSKEQLADEIKQAHADVTQAATSAGNFAMIALKRAVETGHYLLQAKNLCEHGTWLNWIDEQKLGLSTTTVSRYINLAKRFKFAGSLKDINSIRQAYLKLDIIPEAEATGAASPKDLDSPNIALSAPDYISKIQSTSLYLVKAASNIDLKTLDTPQITALSKDVKSLKKIFDELDKQIDKTLNNLPSKTKQSSKAKSKKTKVVKKAEPKPAKPKAKLITSKKTKPKKAATA